MCDYVGSIPVSGYTIHNDSLAIPESKFHGANMWPIWGRQHPDGPHVGHMNVAILDHFERITHILNGLDVSYKRSLEVYCCSCDALLNDKLHWEFQDEM